MQRRLGILLFGMICLTLGVSLQCVADWQWSQDMYERYLDLIVENSKLHTIVGPYRWLKFEQLRQGHQMI
jgi:hypothetical protein